MKIKIPFMWGENYEAIGYDYIVVDKESWENASPDERKSLLLQGEWSCTCPSSGKWTLDQQRKIVNQINLK
jgi:hypothetical protein